MAGARGDSIARYFKKGADIEISSDEEGFRGSWYAGTVIRPPVNAKNGSAKVLVEYNTLMEDEAGRRPLREKLELVQLRPPPPRENRRTFKFSEEVDAYYNDGWWEGIITEVAGEDKYLVFFRGTREQIAFKASELRLHREWSDGKWFPPLEQPPDVMLNNENILFSAKEESDTEVIEHNFSPGDLVEVSSDEEGFEGAWYAATVLRTIKAGKYLIEYQNLRNDDDTDCLREEVDGLHIRPCPPDIEVIDRFELGAEVDAFYSDGWWFGVISKVLKNDRYSVYFRTTDEDLKFKHSDLRLHQEWINGKWHTAFKALKL